MHRTLRSQERGATMDAFETKLLTTIITLGAAHIVAALTLIGCA
jgi:hypothetical protein